MNRLLLSLLVVALLATARRSAADAPTNGPVRIEGQITDQDPKVKFQLDPKSARELRAKPYEVRLVAGKRYTIMLNAAETGKDSPRALDPYLVVQDASGKTLAHDDDSGGNLNAKLTLIV